MNIMIPAPAYLTLVVTIYQPSDSRVSIENDFAHCAGSKYQALSVKALLTADE